MLKSNVPNWSVAGILPKGTARQKQILANVTQYRKHTQHTILHYHFDTNAKILPSSGFLNRSERAEKELSLFYNNCRSAPAFHLWGE